MSTAPNTSRLNSLISEAAHLFTRQKTIADDIMDAIQEATLTSEEIKQCITDLEQATPMKDWQYRSWLYGYNHIKENARSAARRLNSIDDYGLFVEIEVDPETSEIQTLDIPFRFYVPDYEAHPQIDTRDPDSVAQYVWITPEMIELLVFSVSQNSGIDDEGERYNYETLDELQIVFDYELFESAVYDYLKRLPEFQHCDQLQFDVDALMFNLVNLIAEELRETEDFPSYYTSYKVSAIWEFLRLPVYNKEIVADWGSRIQ